MARLALNLDGTAMLLNNPMHDGQAKPGSLPDFLGGEERREDFWQVFFWNAVSRVGHDGLDMAVGPFQQNAKRASCRQREE